MMQHEITNGAGRYKRNLRKGRGESSGHGKTSGRGTKGSGARTGKPIKRGHEGGQTTIFRRLPIRGFSNDRFERHFHVVNLADLGRFDDGATVDATTLIEAGLVPDKRWPVKILGEGEFSKKLTIVADWYSKSAHEKITAAGGTAQNPSGAAFEFPKPKKKFIPREGGPGKKAKFAAAETPADAPAQAAPEKPKADEPKAE